MKVTRWIALVLCISVLLLSTACSSVRSADALKNISDKTEVDFSSAAVSLYQDTHEGFLGDGATFAVVNCKNTGIKEKIAANPNWKPFPPSDTIRRIFYGIKGSSSLLSQLKGSPEIPDIQMGYYYFLDRHDESKDRHSEEGVFDRASLNFSAAVYDDATDRLFFFEFDT